MTGVAERLSAIDASIADAARRAGRDAAEITRIVVTKFHPAALVRELYGLGVREVAENRQQELSAKVEALRPSQSLSKHGPGLEGLRWHFIGQAQTTRPPRYAAPLRPCTRWTAPGSPTRSIARRSTTNSSTCCCRSISPTTRIAGASLPAELERLAEHVLELPTLRLRGVMAVAPLDEDPAAAFARVHDYAERLRGIAPDATWISAGMTGDYADAIAAGATHLRIGTAITGPRPAQG